MWAVALKVTGLIVLFDWSGRALQPFDLVKSLYSRAFEWLLIALVIAAVLSWGAGIVPRTRLHLLVVLIALANAFSALFAADVYVAAFGTQGRYLGLTFVADMVVLYVAVAVAFRNSRDWATFFGGIALAVVASLVYAWVQFNALDPFAWSGSALSRPFSTIGNANTYGHLLSVTLGASAGVAVLYAGPRRWLVRGFAGALTAGVLIVAGVVATRGTVLGVAAATVAVPVIFLRLRGTSQRNVAIAVGSLLLSCAIALGMLVSSTLGTRVVATLNGFATQDRLLVWEGSFRAFLDRPLTGFGPDGLEVAWPSYRQVGLARLVGAGITVDSAHNWVLQSLATTGIIGFATVLAAIVGFGSSLLVVGLRRAGLCAGVIALAAAGYWAHALVSVGTIGVDWVPWVAFGATTSFLADDCQSTGSRRVKTPVLVGIIAAALALSSFGLRALDGNQEARRAREASDLKQGATAVEHGLRAVSLDPGRADYWNELGRADFVAARWTDSADAFGEAIRRAPHEGTYRSNLARALTQLALSGDGSRGGADPAIRSGRDATSADPNEPLTHVALAQVAFALGRADLALTEAVEAIRLYPQDPSYDALVTATVPQLADLTSARTAVEQALLVRETARLRVALGNIALRQGDRNAALENARRALALEPSNTEAQALVRVAGG